MPLWNVIFWDLDIHNFEVFFCTIFISYRTQYFFGSNRKKTSPGDHESNVKIDSSKCSTLSIFCLQLMYYFAYVSIDFLVKRFIWATILTLNKICGSETFVYQKALIRTFYTNFYYKINFVISQHQNTKSKGDFVLKPRFCLPESFNKNILYHLIKQNNLCEFTTLEDKF